ncbi:hypothetical protein [Pantoea phytobeneficialis]|uniref:Uncharacterized protein n=1 Tax=Pantoea phytobeneficialis TaxID=2052056 RepID=A0ABT8XY27_9GAMM|nr:hypothetical protein [Pantoea phytobeneficialis]MDO6408353.1 hypothetical protein [Pantoea phytobeneficialis]
MEKNRLHEPHWRKPEQNSINHRLKQRSAEIAVQTKASITTNIVHLTFTGFFSSYSQDKRNQEISHFAALTGRLRRV